MQSTFQQVLPIPKIAMETVPGDWRKDVQSGYSGLEEISSLRGSCAKTSVLDTMKDALKDYLNSEEGSVPWQVIYVRRTSHYAV